MGTNKKCILSVIVPVYNTEKYIKECVESIALQSDEDMEIILVDDGSTDASGIICDNLCEKYRNVYSYHQKNKGVSEARNLGMDMAHGRYYNFTDSDDYWLENKYQSLKEQLKKGDDLVYVRGYKSYDESNGRIKKEYWAGEVSENDKGIDMMSRFRGGSHTVFFLSDIINRNAIRFKSGIMIAEDADFNLEFSKYMKTVLLHDDYIYVYRIERIGSAWTTQSYEARKTRLELVIKRRDQWLKTGTEEDYRILQIIADGFFGGYMWKLGGDSQKKRKEIIGLIEKEGIDNYLELEKRWIELRDRYGYERAVVREYTRHMYKHKIKSIIKTILVHIPVICRRI